MISMISIIIILVPLESNILTNRRKIIPKEKTQYSSRHRKKIIHKEKTKFSSRHRRKIIHKGKEKPQYSSSTHRKKNDTQRKH
jgi:hypothetical protein